jgi:hypothetical protein
VVAAVVMMTLLRSDGPKHVLAIPARFGTYVRQRQLEQEAGAKQLQREVTSNSAGQARHVVSAVYENSSGGTAGKTAQIMLFIGGNLSGTSPGAFISSFTSRAKAVHLTSAGSMPGQAACIGPQPGVPGGGALCAWVDNDTFGVVASPSMTESQLATQMRAIRPHVERLVK